MKKIFFILILLTIQFSVFAQNININDTKNISVNQNAHSTSQHNKNIQTQKEEYFKKIYYKTLYLSWQIIQQNKNIQDKILKIEVEIDKNGNLLHSRMITPINKEIDEFLLNTLKQFSPYEKLPDEWNTNTIKHTYFLNTEQYLENKIKNNANLSILKNDYYAVAKISFDKETNIPNIEIIQSSNDNSIDNELINAISKIDFDELSNENKDSLYLTIRSVIDNINWNFHAILSKANISSNKKLINWQAFLEEAEKQGKKNWNVYKAFNSYKIKILLILDKEGKIIERNIVQSSGIKEADDAALASIDKGIYPKVPQEYENDTIPIELTFDYIIANKPIYHNFSNSNEPKSKFYKLIKETSMPRN